MELHAGFIVFLIQSVKSVEHKANCNECYRKNADPHKHAGNALGLQIHEEIGIDQGGGGSGDQNGRIELQNDSLHQHLRPRFCREPIPKLYVQ